MSAQATSWAWSHAETVEAQGQLLVLLALAEHADPRGVCYPRRKTIARLCGFSSSGTVTRNINKLADLDLVEKTSRFVPVEDGEARRQTSNIYRLKLEVAGVDPGGACAPPGGIEQEELPGAAPAPPQEPNNGEPKKEPQPSGVDAECRQVYDHWLALFKPARPPKFGPPVIRVISKGLAAFSADDLCRAYDGLYAFRSRKPGDTGLGTPFKTHPNSGTMVERLEFFIGQSKSSAPGGGKYPSGDRAIVSEHQRWVLRGHRRSDSDEAVKQAKESELWLYEHGIVVVRQADDQQPSFRPRTDDDPAPSPA